VLARLLPVTVDFFLGVAQVALVALLPVDIRQTAFQLAL
jgi:hypothetical protein